MNRARWYSEDKQTGTFQRYSIELMELVQSMSPRECGVILNSWLPTVESSQITLLDGV